MTTTTSIAKTETGRGIDRGAQDGRLALFEAGAVEVLGGTLALVEDGEMVYAADGKGCGCGAAEDRDGRRCEHQWALYFAATAGGADRETAA